MTGGTNENFLFRVAKEHMHANEKVGDNSYSDYRFTVAGNQRGKQLPTIGSVRK